MADEASVARAATTIARTNKLFIDNAYCEAENGATVQVVSPIDGSQLSTIAHASKADVDRAVRSARACFDAGSWPGVPVEERSAVLRRIAAALRESGKLAELAVIESQDCGKPLAESKADIGFCADVFDYYARIAPEQLQPTSISLPEGAGASQDFAADVVNQPLGVVGCVTPWNFPLGQAVMKVAPALAAGCCVVLKPSPLASLTCCALGEVVAEAGAPPGALSVVTGGPPEQLPGGESTGQALIDHPFLDKVSFTGSGATGRKVLEASASQLRPSSLELGGKSAFLVFDDAEEYLDAVADWVQVGVFSNAGQVCCSTSRLLVQRGLEQKLVSKLLTAMKRIRVGDPMAEGTQLGPLVSEVQRKKVACCVQRASEDGCKVHSADMNIPPALASGFYIAPTVLTDVPTTSAAWREEIFGPVLAVKAFDTEEEAVTLANDTAYGLGNAVYSKDAQRCQRVAAKLKSGIVWQNCSNVLFEATPFGGRAGRASGFGFEGGVAGLKEYVSPKTVVRATTPGFSLKQFPVEE